MHSFMICLWDLHAAKYKPSRLVHILMCVCQFISCSSPCSSPCSSCPLIWISVQKVWTPVETRCYTGIPISLPKILLCVQWDSPFWLLSNENSVVGFESNLTTAEFHLIQVDISKRADTHHLTVVQRNPDEKLPPDGCHKLKHVCAKSLQRLPKLKGWGAIFKSAMVFSLCLHSALLAM